MKKRGNGSGSLNAPRDGHADAAALPSAVEPSGVAGTEASGPDAGLPAVEALEQAAAWSKP
jgi:hypothetical protein